MRGVIGSVIVAVLLALPVCAQSSPPSTSQPATQPSPADRERFERLVRLIEDQNSPEARRTGVRELLLQPWPAEWIRARLVGVLDGPNAAARAAVAAVLAELPGHLHPDYLDPLTNTLALDDEAARQAAAFALASFADDRGINRLRFFVLSEEQPLAARLQVLEALGSAARRPAVAALFVLLDAPEPAIRQAALTAINHATGMDFDGNADAARAWWAQTREMPVAEWQQLQIQRLVAQDRRREAQLALIENRLARALRTTYLRTPEAERGALLMSYLGDEAEAVRLLGLELIQNLLAEGKTLSPELAAAARELLSAGSPRLRAAATRAVAALRDPADAERFLEMLTREASPEGRLALINGLGYVGPAAAVAPLCEQLSDPDPRIVTETLTALGRLAEREIIGADQRPHVVAALLAVFERSTPKDIAVRERVLWAMSRVAAPEFRPALLAALDAEEAVPVRRAAIRGLAALDGSNQADVDVADALITATADADVGVRRPAVELLAKRAVTDAHLQALFARLAVAQESEEAIRAAAWEGVVRVLGGRTPEDIERWIGKLPENGPTRHRRTLELLQLALTRVGEGEEQRAARGLLKGRIARQQAALGEAEAALATTQEAVELLQAAGHPQTAPHVGRWIALALEHLLYTPELVQRIQQLAPPPDDQLVWEQVRPMIAQRLTPARVEAAVNALEALQALPPLAWSEPVQADIAALDQQARGLLAEVDAQRVDAAIGKLLADAEDADAQASLRALGPRAIPQLRARLQAVIQDEAGDAGLEALLLKWARELQPDWGSYAIEAPREEKLRALERLSG